MMVLLFFLVEARRPLIWFCIFLERGAPLGGGQADNQGVVSSGDGFEEAIGEV